MDGEEMYSDRVASFSYYLDSAEESIMPQLAKGVPVQSPEVSSYSNNLERTNKTEPEDSRFGAHKDFSKNNGVCMRSCTIFACEETCLQKKADYSNGSVDHRVHGIVQSQPGLENVEQFSFPVLNSRIENLKVKKHVNIAEVSVQGPGDKWNSVEMTKKDDIAVNLERKFSRLTWNAIPNTRSLVPASSGSSSWYDDTDTSNSSEFLEIENNSSTRYPMTLSRQEPQALNKAQIYDKAGAAGKSLTLFDDEHKNRNCVGDKSSTYTTTKPKYSCKVRSGVLWLLGCMSNKAVRVAENTSSVSENAKGGAKRWGKYPSTRKGPSPMQPTGK